MKKHIMIQTPNTIALRTSVEALPEETKEHTGIFTKVLLLGYKYTFCRDIRHCIGLCGIKWTPKQEQKAIEESYQNYL